MADCGFAYCDLKPENVVVRMTASGEYHLALCDLGGLARLGAYTISTFPPPASPSGVNVPATEGTMLWSLAAFTVALLRGLDRGLFFDDEKHPNDSEGIERTMWKRVREVSTPDAPFGRFLTYAAREHARGGTLVDALLLISGMDRAFVGGKRRRSEGCVGCWPAKRPIKNEAAPSP